MDPTATKKGTFTSTTTTRNRIAATASSAGAVPPNMPKRSPLVAAAPLVREETPIFTHVQMKPRSRAIGGAISSTDPTMLLVRSNKEMFSEHESMNRSKSTNKNKSNNIKKDKESKTKTNHHDENWCVPTVPLYYSLERSTLTIPNDTDATNKAQLDMIVARISNCLRLQSIQCTYHPQHGRMDCCTLDASSSLLQFVLQLWKTNSGRRHPSNHNKSSCCDVFLLEVQRQCGCSIAMKNIRMELFRTILSKGDEKGQVQPPSPPLPHESRMTPTPTPTPTPITTERRCMVPRTPPRPIALCPPRPMSMQRRHADGPPSPSPPSASSPPLPSPRPLSSLPTRPETSKTDIVVVDTLMSRCLQLLESKRYDENLLGMESLRNITSRVHCPEHSRWVSRIIALQDKEDQKANLTQEAAATTSCHRIGKQLWNHLEASILSSHDEPEEKSTIALHVVANILEETTDTAENMSSAMVLTIIDRLMNHFDAAVDHPEQAAISARCLRCLLPLPTATEDGDHDDNYDQRRLEQKRARQLQQLQQHKQMLYPVVCRAHQHGKAHHYLLEKESERLLGRYL